MKILNYIKNLKNKAKIYIFSHKKMSIFIALVIIGGGYLVYRSINANSVAPTYMLGQVRKGTIVSIVSGTGQVSSLNQLDINPKVSGNITSIKVKAGDSVRRGQVLFTIDSRDASKQVRDAQLALQTAQASLDDTNRSNTIALENSYTTLLNSTPEVTSDDVATRAIAMPTISGNYTLGKEGTINITTYLANSGIAMESKGLVKNSQIVDTVNPIALGNSGLFIKFPEKTASGMMWTINIPNKNASNYVSNKINYEQALRTKDEAEKLNSTALLNIEAKKNALSDAQQILSDYYVKASFDGILGTVGINLGQQVSSSTNLGTIITKQQIATIPLNEVDIAKVSIGQKIKATFDAIDNFEINGTVLSVDLIGTVTSGVVNYNVIVGFDTYDERIKSGMSANVSIETQTAKDVLIVPNSAIKTINGNSFVQIAPEGQTVSRENNIVTLEQVPQQVKITKGITDDTNTEVVTGLNEGDIIVLKTITTNTNAKTTTAPSILGTGTNRGPAGSTGGGVRPASR